jgi:hypothetical protein
MNSVRAIFQHQVRDVIPKLTPPARTRAPALFAGTPLPVPYNREMLHGCATFGTGFT